MQEQKPVDFTRATQMSPEVEDSIRDAFLYHPWNEEQQKKGEVVRSSLMEAVRVIVMCVPPSPDRSAAIRKLRECRMDCNSAITHNGKY